MDIRRRRVPVSRRGQRRAGAERHPGGDPAVKQGGRLTHHRGVPEQLNQGGPGTGGEDAGEHHHRLEQRGRVKGAEVPAGTERHRPEAARGGGARGKNSLSDNQYNF